MGEHQLEERASLCLAPNPGAKVSVLMATYARESSMNLCASLESIRMQTRPANQIVLVIDGPVGADQEKVIADFAAAGGPWEFLVVRLEVNGGLANALNIGLAHCSARYILRMDSDDICLPDRIALEIDYLEKHPEIGLVASWAEEFYDEKPNTRLRCAPTTHEAIVQALRWRNIFVHPSVAARAEVFGLAGGYRKTFGLLEDYDLWVRMALAGVHFHIIPKVLVRSRTGVNLIERRGGMRYAINEIRFRYHYLRAGFLNLRQFLVVTTLYVIFRVIAGPLRGRFYSLVRS